MDYPNQFQKAASSSNDVKVEEGTRCSEDAKEQQQQQPKHHRQSSSKVPNTKESTSKDFSLLDPQLLKYPTYVDYANLSPQETAAAPIGEQQQLVEERQQQQQPSHPIEELSPFRTMTSIMSTKTTTISRTNTFPFLLHQMLDVTDRYPERFFIHTMHPMKLSFQEQLQDSTVVHIQSQVQQWRYQQQQQHLSSSVFSPSSLTEQQQIEMIMQSMGVQCFRPRDILRWEDHGRSFMIIDKVGLVKYFFPLFFPYQNEYASFQRQLNLYGFLRLVNPHKLQIRMRYPCFAAVGLSASSRSVEEDAMALPKISVLRYYHEKFLRTRSDLCSLIHRTYHHKTGSIRPKGGRNVRSLLLSNKSRSQYDPASEPDFDSFPPLRYIRKDPILESSSPMTEASIKHARNLESPALEPKGIIVKSMSTSSIASSTQWSLDRIHSNLDIAGLGTDKIDCNDGDPTITNQLFMFTSNHNIENPSQLYPGPPPQSHQENVQPNHSEQQQSNLCQIWNDIGLMEQKSELFEQQDALWMASTTAGTSMMANSMPELDTSSWMLHCQVRRETGVTSVTHTDAIMNHPLNDTNVTSMITSDVNTNIHRQHMKVDDMDDTERHRRLEPSRTSDSSSSYSSSSKKYSTNKRRSLSDSSIVVHPKKVLRHFIGSEITALTPADVSSSVHRSATAYLDHRLVGQYDYLRRTDHHLSTSTNETTAIATYDQETKELDQSLVSRGLIQTSVHPSHFSSSSSSVGLSFPTSSVSASSHLTTTNQSIHRSDDESARGNRISSSMITSRLYQNIRHSPTRGSFTLSSPPRSTQTTIDEHKSHVSSSFITHKTSDTIVGYDPTAVAPTNSSCSQIQSSSEESDLVNFLDDIGL